MRILVVGGHGMLGARLCSDLAARHDVHATGRGAAGAEAAQNVTWHEHVDIRSDDIDAVLARVAPQAIVNAAGIVKQRTGTTTEEFIAVNALFPHRLARLAMDRNALLIQISTDCVFSGSRGGYSLSDRPDPVDIYGLSKLLGEPSGDHVTVLRTSMIGLEDRRRGKPTHGLVEWFLAHDGPRPGFSRSIFSGLTVAELSRVIEAVIGHGGLVGLWHVASAPITKLDLLSRLAARLPELAITVEAAEGPAIDRSLDGRAFDEAMPYRPPSWDVMLDELAGEILSREKANT